jgi:hypothetical protein
MSDVNYSVPEPDPIATDEPAIIDLAIKDIGVYGGEFLILIPHLLDRKAFGIAKHGTPLQKSNGRDHRIDGFQEIEDFIAYMRQGVERGDEEMRYYYWQALVLAADFAQLLEGKEFNCNIKKKTATETQKYA